MVIILGELDDPDGTEPKLISVGLTEISGSTGGVKIPVPQSDTVTSLSSGSLEGIIKFADCPPVALGVKIRVIFSDAPGTSVWPEILPLEIENWLSLIVRLPIIRSASPSLVTVTFRGELGEPTSTSPKSISVGFTEISGSSGGASQAAPFSLTSTHPSQGSFE